MNLKEKKLAVIGANGFLGKHTIQRAIKKGWKVIGIVRRDEAAREIESLGAQSYIFKEFNEENLSKAFKGCKAVIHFANVVCGSLEIFRKVNVEGTQAVVKAAEQSKISRIIYPSGLGTGEYGKIEWANNEYFRSKKLAEEIIQKGKVPFVIFRPSYILGPNDELIPEFLNQIRKSQVTIAGDGKTPMQPIYVENAVDAFLAAAEGKGSNNTIYNLVGPKTLNMLQLIALIYNTTKKLGFDLPKPRIKNILYEKASKELGLCPEMIDVMKCDLVYDGKTTAEALGFQLSPLEKAVEEAVINHLFPKNTNQSAKLALILLSGGIDSTVALYWAKKEGYNLIALSFNYKNRPENEIKATKKLSELISIKLIEVNLPFLEEAIDLKFDGYPILSALNAPEGYIPSRNIIFYSIAAFFADAYGIQTIIGGHINSDAELFPDASSSFFKKLEHLISIGRHTNDNKKMEILLPLKSKTKIEVLDLAKKLDVPLEFTWSCYGDGKKPCGKCLSCIKRERAFMGVAAKDPIIYA